MHFQGVHLPGEVWPELDLLLRRSHVVQKLLRNEGVNCAFSSAPIESVQVQFPQQARQMGCEAVQNCFSVLQSHSDDVRNQVGLCPDHT